MMIKPHSHQHGFCCGTHAAPPAPATARDPVCGMTVDPSRTAHHADHGGLTYHFCCSGCRVKFLADPARYLEPARETASPAHAGAVYTCPMHPEVEQIGPGACPKCGMALEPKDIGAVTGPNPELADMQRRLWIGAVLTLPIVVIAMGEHLVGRIVLPHGIANAIQLVLASTVVLWAGWPFFLRGWQSIASRHLNMFTLIALGTGAAWAYSAVATLSPELFPAGFRAADGTVGVYFEAAAVIVVLVLVGQVLELRARESMGDAIRALLDLSPKMARRIGSDGSERDVPLGEIAVGDRLRVRPGETVPVDGSIREGRSAINESMVTGESMPHDRTAGESVIGGTVNGAGSFVMEAEKVGCDTLLARIVQMVGSAQRSRAPIQHLADVVSGRFVPAVLLVAALAFLAWAVFGPEPRLTHALIAAVSVLIVACPCALGLATPMSMVVGMGRGARVGVLMRDAAALERFEQVDTLVLDKTGTVTSGRPDIVAIEGRQLDAEHLLRLAASLEQGSEHPIAGAIARGAEAKHLTLTTPSDIHIVPGRGIDGIVEGHHVLVGTDHYLRDRNVTDLEPLLDEAARRRRVGDTVVFVSTDGHAAGFIAVADPVKPTARESLDALRRDGLRLIMASGDHVLTAEGVAADLGFAEVHAGLLPEDKAALVGKLKGEGRIVGMVGDGINDAPALALADVGIAMGGGADIAMQSAGVTLLQGDLARLRLARQLSRATMRNIRQNLAFAFLYNALGVPVAAGVLFPVLGVTLSPMLAAAAMALSSVSVIGNALRLRMVALD